jgi:hypothetical protein
MRPTLQAWPRCPGKQVQLAAQQDKFTEDLAEGMAVVAPKVSDRPEVRLQVP